MTSAQRQRRRGRRPLGRRFGDESGLATTELVIITPVFFVMVLLPIHVSLWWHAKQTVDLAVEEALDAAQVDGASEADGHAAADAILGQVGNVENPAVSVSINPGTDVVSVTISGRSRYRIVPGPWYVTAAAEGRIERFIGEQERET